MNRRPLAALASVVLTVLGIVLLLPPKCAYACSCAMPPGSQDALADSEAVFSGEVVVQQGTATARSPGYDTATLRVSEVWHQSGTLLTPYASVGFLARDGPLFLPPLRLSRFQGSVMLLARVVVVISAC